jgi:hypothetical protein
MGRFKEDTGYYWIPDTGLLLTKIKAIKYAGCFQYPVSSIQYPVSSIQYPVSSIKYPVSCIFSELYFLFIVDVL